MEEALPFIKWLASAGGTAVAAGCVWLVYSGRLILKREIDGLKAQCAEEQRIWKERYEELKTESVERLNNLRAEKDYWRGIALRAANLLDRAVETPAKGPTGIGE